MSVMKPSVVTDTTLPPNFCILCKHSPTTLLMNAVVHETINGLDNVVAVTLELFLVNESKFIFLFLFFDIPTFTNITVNPISNFLVLYVIDMTFGKLSS